MCFARHSEANQCKEKNRRNLCKVLLNPVIPRQPRVKNKPEGISARYHPAETASVSLQSSVLLTVTVSCNNVIPRQPRVKNKPEGISARYYQPRHSEANQCKEKNRRNLCKVLLNPVIPRQPRVKNKPEGISARYQLAETASVSLQSSVLLAVTVSCNNVIPRQPRVKNKPEGISARYYQPRHSEANQCKEKNRRNLCKVSTRRDCFLPRSEGFT